VLAQVHQREPQLLLLILHDGLRRLREEHLAAAGGGADPGRAMDGQARVGSLGRDRVAGVNADPHPDRRAGWPLVARQGPLDLQRAQHGLLRVGKRHEERVALRVHLVAGVLSDGRADQPPVLGQDLPVAVSQGLDQPGRPLDIAEQECDQPARKPGHLAVSHLCWARFQERLPAA
jgi:hypothetical protein